MELQHLKKVFIEINNFPSAVVKRIIKHVGRERQQQQPPNNNVELEETKIIQATLPYAGEKGEQVIKEMKKHIKRLKHHKFCLLYTSPSPRDGLLSRMPSSA